MMRPMPTTRGAVSLTVVTNYASFGLALALAFVLSPLLIRSLGDARYGTWVLIGQLTGYFTMLDFGLRGALAFHVGSRLAERRHEDVPGLFASAFWAVLVVAGLAALLALSVLDLLPRFFSMGQLWEEARPAFAVVIVTVATALVVELYAAVLQAARRPYLFGLTDIFSRIVAAALVYAIVVYHGGLLELSAAQLVARGLAGALTVCLAVRLVTLSVSWRDFRPRELGTLFGYARQTATINIAQVVTARIDMVVAGAMLGMTDVTRYSIGLTLVFYAVDAVNRFGLAFTPHFTHLFASGEVDRCRWLYLKAQRICGLLTVVIAGYLVAFGTAFLTLWLGRAYVSGAPLSRSDVVMFVLLIGLVPRMFHSVTKQLLYGTRRLRVLVLLQYSESLATLVLCLLLVRRLSIAGIALAVSLPALVTGVAVLPAYVNRRFHIPWPLYWQQTLRPVLLVGTMNLGFSLSLARYGPIETWPWFALNAGLAAAVGALLVWVFGLPAGEREELLAHGRSLFSSARAG
jgi:O-antigen/teichoic acid export membrane protein